MEKKATGNEELKITEWKYNQFLGEKMSWEQINSDLENMTFIVTNSHFSDDGNMFIVSDKGGRIIMFKRYESKNKHPKLNYYYEFGAHQKDFDVHKSIEYDEGIRAFQILNNYDKEKVDILTAGYRTIKFHRIYYSKIKSFKSDSDKTKISIPKLKETQQELTDRTKKEFKNAHTSEINSLTVNKINTNNFISSDEFKALLWDLNVSKEVYNVVDLENPDDESDNLEKITSTKFSNYNPSLFAFGTNKGKLSMCDLRTNSNVLSTSKSYFEENSSLSKTIFANALMSVHDISFNQSNNFLLATRHYLSVNLWDARKFNAPLTKFLLYEPVINKLSFLYQNNFLSDKFTLSSDATGSKILTGGYNNMFHVLDINQRLNTQITMNDSSEKLMNTNVIRKVNSKGSCYYKKDDPSIMNINFNYRIVAHDFSPKENFISMISLNCIYTYSGNEISKKK